MSYYDDKIMIEQLNIVHVKIKVFSLLQPSMIWLKVHFM